ncbi:MAG: hypothetical protein A2Z95_06130 [Gallionellales bacterium GWA2_60_18]|nr:MAG: hypothetical protein A2Z95_06130 [Gallionellales bacterium GWA2_60_18]
MSAVNPEMAAIARKAGVLASLSIAANCMMTQSHPPDAGQCSNIALDLMDAAAYLSAEVSSAMDELVYER